MQNNHNYLVIYIEKKYKEFIDKVLPTVFAIHQDFIFVLSAQEFKIPSRYLFFAQNNRKS